MVKERMRLSEGIDEGKRATVCLGLYVGDDNRACRNRRRIAWKLLPADFQLPSVNDPIQRIP